MIIYHVRPKDLHAPGKHCNTYDCTGVVMKYDYDALAARLAEAESLLTAVPHTSERESILDLHAAILAFLRAADNGPAFAGFRNEHAAEDRQFKAQTADSGDACPECEMVGNHKMSCSVRKEVRTFSATSVSADAGLTVNSECPHCNGTIVYGTIYCSYCGSTWTNVRK